MILDKQEISQKIKKVIEDEREMTIDSSDQQLDIDSFTMMLVIMFVKDELGIQLDMEKLDFDAFCGQITFVQLFGSCRVIILHLLLFK